MISAVGINVPWTVPCIFLMLNMAGGIARGRVRTTTSESRNIVAILQITY